MSTKKMKKLQKKKYQEIFYENFKGGVVTIFFGA